MAKMKNKDLEYTGKKEKYGVGQFILTVCLLIYTFICALPILLVFISAFSDEMSITQYGYSYFPKAWSLNGMNAVLRYGKQLYQSYMNTIIITLVGTGVGLLVMSMYAFVLTRHDFMLRKFLSVFMLIPMLFQGGQLSAYLIFTGTYHLKDNLLVLILPIMVSTMNIIILRTYIQTSVPEELMDSARIDGAGEFRTFFQITFPLMKPALAAVGFMMATMYWNDWQNALMFMDTASKKPLQLLLINIQKSIEMLVNARNIPSSALAAMQGSIPQATATMSTVIIVIGPIMVAYPFFQKYFIKGLTVGSVKG